MAVRDWEEGKGGIRIPISPAFVRKLEEIRVGLSLSRAQFKDEYSLGTSTYNKWKQYSSNKLVDSKVVIRICQLLCRKQGLQIDQLDLPDITVEFLRRVRAENESAWREDDAQADVIFDTIKGLRLTVDLNFKHDVREQVKEAIIVAVAKFAPSFISFGFRIGSLILRLRLTAEDAQHLIDAADDGAFSFAGYQGYRIIPRVDASELSLRQRLSMLAEFARRIDRYHSLDVSYNDISIGRMYSTHLDSDVVFSESSGSNQSTKDTASTFELEFPLAVGQINWLTIPEDRFIPNEIRALGRLLVKLVNPASMKETETDLNEADFASGEIESIDQLRSIIEMALDYDPYLQFPTPGEFANAIDAYLRGERQYTCYARRVQMLAWRAGFALGKFESQLRVLYESVNAMTSMADRSMDTQVLALARLVADELLDVPQVLIGWRISESSREMSGPTEQAGTQCSSISQVLATASIETLKEKLHIAVEWGKGLLSFQSACWRRRDSVAGEVFCIALNAEALVRNVPVEVEWRQSEAINDAMQRIGDRIHSAAQASRRYSDIQVRASILNREMVQYFRWSVIGRASLTHPERSVDQDRQLLDFPF